MKLSICIPTYNRLPFLKWTLARLREDFPRAEIIVCDNASRDGTGPYALASASQFDSHVRYVQQATNVGAFNNMYAAFEHSIGDYAIYCADDDYLLPAEVERAISYLGAHPEVGAYCAPCMLWDEVADKPYWKAFEIDEPRTFDCGQEIDLFNFIIERHVWPEHIVYRTPVPLKPRTRAYWAFADIPDILDAAGAIHFDPTPFYRNVLVHPVGEREQLGMQQCLTDFDEYRAGLEVLAHGLFGDGLPYQARHRIQEMIQAFICQRMDLAAMLYDRRGDSASAQMLRRRLAIASPVRDEVPA